LNPNYSRINYSKTSTKLFAAALIAMLPVASLPAQKGAPERIDLSVLHTIKSKAFQHSQVMDRLFYLSEVNGPRVTNSTNFRNAGAWVVKRLESYGMTNVHLEKSGPFGTG